MSLTYISLPQPSIRHLASDISLGHQLATWQRDCWESPGIKLHEGHSCSPPSEGGRSSSSCITPVSPQLWPSEICITPRCHGPLTLIKDLGLSTSAFSTASPKQGHGPCGHTNTPGFLPFNSDCSQVHPTLLRTLTDRVSTSFLWPQTLNSSLLSPIFSVYTSNNHC